MKNVIRHILILAVAAAPLTIAAQHTRSGYFLDDYNYRYELNPAFGNNRGFISMPAIGNLNVGVNGNLHVDNLFYNINGRTTSFMNPGVDASDFLSGIKDVSKINVNTKINILSLGFKGFKGYNTISLSARTDVNTNIPKSLFSLLKEGLSNKVYRIDDFGARTNAYAEVALNHSHNIGKEWRIGITAKALVGAGNVDARFNDATLSLGEDSWSVTSDACINSSLKGLTYETTVNDRTGHRYVNGADIDSPGIGGFGFAADLGVVYTPSALPGWSFSAAVLDLGFINWDNNMLATTNGPKSFSSDGYVFDIADFNPTWDRIQDKLTSLYELDDMGDLGKRRTSLAPTLNVGVEYTLPFYRRLTLGLLNTSRFNGDYSWTDFRLSANIAPLKCMEASANIAYGTFGSSFGWLFNFHVPGFNLFFGMDHTVTRVSKDYIPLSSNASVNLGLNFPF